MTPEKKTMKDFLVALMLLDFYRSFPENYPEKLKQYEQITGDYIDWLEDVEHS